MWTCRVHGFSSIFWWLLDVTVPVFQPLKFTPVYLSAFLGFFVFMIPLPACRAIFLPCGSFRPTEDKFRFHVASVHPYRQNYYGAFQGATTAEKLRGTQVWVPTPGRNRQIITAKTSFLTNSYSIYSNTEAVSRIIFEAARCETVLLQSVISQSCKFQSPVWVRGK